MRHKNRPEAVAILALLQKICIHYGLFELRDRPFAFTLLSVGLLSWRLFFSTSCTDDAELFFNRCQLGGCRGAGFGLRRRPGLPASTTARGGALYARTAGAADQRHPRCARRAGSAFHQWTRHSG